MSSPSEQINRLIAFTYIDAFSAVDFLNCGKFAQQNFAQNKKERKPYIQMPRGNPRGIVSTETLHPLLRDLLRLLAELLPVHDMEIVEHAVLLPEDICRKLISLGK